jgi:hypothetical protein
MRKFLIGTAAMVAVALAAYLGIFQREALWALWTRSKLGAQGYGPAKTPTEAMDKFLKAVKDRNYEAAESYLGGDYAEQFHKGAKNAQPLRSVTARVELRKEGDGDNAQWKIYFGVNPDLRQCVDYLAENGSNYVNASTASKRT